MILALALHAQKYNTALGIRLDPRHVGLTLQQRTGEFHTMEGILEMGTDEFTGTLLMERHFPLLFRSFNIYLGGGAHLGNIQNTQMIWGPDAIAGVELKTPLLPLLLSLDVKPRLDFNYPSPELGFKATKLGLEAGFSARLILMREKGHRSRRHCTGKAGC